MSSNEAKLFWFQRKLLPMGPYLKDVCNFFLLFDPYPPHVCSFNIVMSAIFVQFLTPPPLDIADVFYVWSLSFFESLLSKMGMA